MRVEHILFECMFAFSGVLDVPCSVFVFFSYESYDLGKPLVVPYTLDPLDNLKRQTMA